MFLQNDKCVNNHELDLKQEEELKRLRSELRSDRHKVSKLEKRLRGQTSSYIITIFVLVGVYVWKDLLEHLINKFFNYSKSELAHKLTMAILFTVISCLVIYYCVRFIERNGDHHLEEDQLADDHR